MNFDGGSVISFYELIVEDSEVQLARRSYVSVGDALFPNLAFVKDPIEW